MADVHHATSFINENKHFKTDHSSSINMEINLIFDFEENYCFEIFKNGQ